MKPDDEEKIGAEWSFRETLQALLDDSETDFTDAVLVLPKMRQVTHDSPMSLTALGVLEWCKSSLCAGADDDCDDGCEPQRVRGLDS